MSLEEIEAAAKQLPPEEQEILIYALHEELAPADQERLERLWSDEIHRRHQARVLKVSKSQNIEEAVGELRMRMDEASKT